MLDLTNIVKKAHYWSSWRAALAATRLGLVEVMLDCSKSDTWSSRSTLGLPCAQYKGSPG